MPTRIDAGRGRAILPRAARTTPGSAGRFDMGLDALAAGLERRNEIREAKEAEAAERDRALAVSEATGQAQRELTAYLDKAGEAYDGAEPGFAEQAAQDVEGVLTNII